MSGESTQNPGNQNSWQATANWPPQNGTAPSEESPELLRWRADMLLDEMMLGAVDISASSDTVAPDAATFSDTHFQSSPLALHPSPVPPNRSINGSTPEQPPLEDVASGQTAFNQPSFSQPSAPSLSNNGWHEGEQPAASDTTWHSTADNQPSGHPHHGPNGTVKPHDYKVSHHAAPARAGNDSQTSEYTSGSSAMDPSIPSQRQGYVSAPSAVDANRADEPSLHRPSAVESVERGRAAPQMPVSHESFERPTSTPPEERWQPLSYTDNTPPSTHPAGDYPPPTYHTGYNTRSDERPNWSVASGASNDYLTSVPRSTDTPHTAPPHTEGQPERPGYGATYTEPGAPHSNRQQPWAEPIPTLGPITGNRPVMPFADSITVGPQARRVSNLLPRQSQFDLQTLQQEMAALEEDIHARMPAGHATTERALYLLEKGRTILHTDPERSAEVSYYIQQVKAILERSSQRYQWSDLYRNRLTLYFVAWLGLALVVILARALYASQLDMFLLRMVNLAETGFIMQHWMTFFGTIFAGIMGGALGALINMWRHSRKRHGFFDRKYGMLGLVLPIIGAVFGMLLYLIIGVGYALFNIDPSVSLLATTLPALLAFLFGISQEHIYGTAE